MAILTNVDQSFNSESNRPTSPFWCSLCAYCFFYVTISYLCHVFVTLQDVQLSQKTKEATDLRLAFQSQ